jgi:hypothetical protein
MEPHRFHPSSMRCRASSLRSLHSFVVLPHSRYRCSHVARWLQDALPVTDIDAIILQDLQSAQSSLAAFGNALINDFPVRAFPSTNSIFALCPDHGRIQADLVPQATALRDNIVNAFAPAIAAYSS